MNSYLDPILARWRSDPESTFAHFYGGGEWARISLDRLMRRAMQFAQAIARTGAGDGDVVFVTLPYGLDAHAAFIGAMVAGTAASFLPHPSVKQDQALYWTQHREVFAHIAPKAVIVRDDLRDAYALSLTNLGVAIVAASESDAAFPTFASPPPPDDAVGIVQYSSGTTGLKKGVALTYRAICRQLAAYVQSLALHQVADPCIATWLPLYHDMGLISGFLMPLRLGVPIVGIDPFVWVANPALLLEAVQAFGATHLWLPNFAFHHVVRATPKTARYDLTSLQMIVSCSEPCKPAAFDGFLARFSADGLKPESLQTCYAMAETVFAVSQSAVGRAVRRLAIARTSVDELGTVRPPEGDADRVVLLSNGRPINGCEVGILRDAGFLGEREIGEVCVRAPFLFDGYHKNEPGTREAFAGDWYRTGDLGFLDDGEIFIVGRLKEIIIVNGKNVFAHDVEAALSNIPGLKPGRAVAFGRYAETLGSEQLIVVAERDDVAVELPRIVSDINRVVLDEIGIACGDIRIVDPGWLIKTTSGKISRSLNSAKYEAAFRP